MCEKRKCVVTQENIVGKDVNSKENVVRLGTQKAKGNKYVLMCCDGNVSVSTTKI